MKAESGLVSIVNFNYKKRKNIEKAKENIQ